MDVGTQVEVKQGAAWLPGKIADRYANPLDKDASVIIVELESGGTQQFSLASVSDIPSNLRLANDKSRIDDLTELIELNEDSLLEALEARFHKKKIYTNTGAILLAINPFEKLSGLYNNSVLQLYLEAFDQRQSTVRTAGDSLPPHIYRIAGDAYKAMVYDLKDQSVLVSGESGSGKTESTKFLMEYLAQAGASQHVSTAQSAAPRTSLRRSVSSFASSSGIAAKVLETNMVLEAFGNARTLRNDNSSRFGKFIKLHFTSGGQLTGASIQTYLMEKVRLVSQSTGERNYHVFYQVMVGASDSERERWRLDPPTSQDSDNMFMHYRYLNQSDCFERRDGVDDVDMFHRVKGAMDVIGFTSFERDGIFDVVAALLHIGNLTFDETSDAGGEKSGTTLRESCYWSRDAAASLLKLDSAALEEALSTRKIRAGSDFVSVKLSAEQATNARDALAKTLYGNLFDWMVLKINEFLRMDDQHRARGGSLFIGILDIFGFEVFPNNSFEQLCINFANETLQQQFNEYVFKLEQQEYESQGVDWKYVDFPDNQDCVQLISQRPTGILSLVDEECVMPKGSDSTLASKLYRSCDHHARFSASRIQQAKCLFTISHYAGNVEYSCVGFLEKNKEALHQEAVDLLAQGPEPGSFTKMLCDVLAFRQRAKSSPATRPRRGSTKQKGGSVGLQFKEQLTTLIDTLHQTSPRYVRCIKPNETSESGVLSKDRVLNQLRCNGVMEAVRVSRAGYPIRLPHEDFVGRYFTLKKMQSTLKLGEKAEDARYSDATAEAKELLRELVVKMPKQTKLDEPSSDFKSKCLEAGIQMGSTKMFFKQPAYEFLEDLRKKRLRRHMDTIYHAVLCFYARQRFLRTRHGVQSLQVHFRYQKVRAARRHAKAVKVQSFLRMACRRRQFVQARKAVRVVQCRFRLKRHVRAVQRKKARAAEEDRKRRQHEEEERKRRERAEEERKKQEMNKARPPPPSLPEAQQADIVHYDDTASSESSSGSSSPLAAKEAAAGESSSSQSEDYYPFNDSIPEHLVASMDEDQGRVSEMVPKRISHADGNGDQVLDYLQEEPTSRASIRESLTSSKGFQTPVSRSRGPSNASGGSSPSPKGGRPTFSLSRKSSLRSTRSSRTVALPRLDAVQETSWVNDEDRFSCHICNKRFSVFKRKHHCRACGEVICKNCSFHHPIRGRTMRVCVSCVAFHSLDDNGNNAANGMQVATPMSSRSRGDSHQSTDTNRKTSNGSSQFDQTRSSTASGGLWMNAWPEPPYPDDEEERLAVLKEMNVHDLASSGKFNMYCEVAAKTMKCPIAYVSIVDEDEQILVANIGMMHTTLPREMSFCAHTICQDGVMVVLDTKQDDRFRENPMVKGREGAVKIRYYAGATIFSVDGHALGTVAVFDTKPRKEADQDHIGMLQHLSFLASEKMTQSSIQEDADMDLM